MIHIDKKYILLLVFLGVIVGGGFFDTNSEEGMIVVFAQCVATIGIICTLYSILRRRIKRAEEAIDGLVGKLLGRLFGRIFKKMSVRSERKTRFVNGRDRIEYVGISDKRGKKRKKLKRIDSEKYEGSGERIRLLYLKYILKAIDKGRDVHLTHTPREVRASLNEEGNGTLFSEYERVRYSKSPTVDKNTLEECENTVDTY